MDYLSTTLESLSSGMGDVFPKFIGAILILIIGMWIARMIRKFAFKVLEKTKLDERFSSSGHLLKIYEHRR